MLKNIALILLSSFSFATLMGQGTKVTGCPPEGGLEPALVANAENKVTFHCSRATPLDLIQAVGFQSRLPIGLVLGRDADALTKTKRVYQLDQVDAKLALQRAIEGTGYSIKEEDHVYVIVAGDLAPRQRELLAMRYPNLHWGTERSQTMGYLGSMLTIAMRQAVHPMSGIGMSLSSGPNEERFMLNIPPASSTEEIANQIVSHGSRGMWTLKASPSFPINESNDEVKIQPYQHYSNKPIIEHEL